MTCKERFIEDDINARESLEDKIKSETGRRVRGGRRKWTNKR